MKAECSWPVNAEKRVRVSVRWPSRSSMCVQMAGEVGFSGNN